MFEKLRTNRLYLFLGPLALTAPLAPFLHFYDIPFLSSTVFFSYMILILIGLVAGFVMAYGGALMQTLVSSGVIVLIIFSEIERKFLYMDGLRHRYLFLICVFTLSVFLYFIREHRAKFLFIFVGVIWLGGVGNLNVSTPSRVFTKPVLSGDASLPPYIHIVLDEHIGVEGVPAYADKQNKINLEIKDKYIERGFRVFGRAYSRFFNSEDSFASFLNFQSEGDPRANLKEKRIFGRVVTSLKTNALFENLSNRGYVINVFESYSLSYCGEKETIRLGKCVSYRPNALNYFTNEAIILSGLVKKFRLLKVYNKIAEIFEKPLLNTDSSTASMQTYVKFNEFFDFLGEGKTGNAYFIHLLLPHSAYILDENCSYEKDRNFYEKEALDKTYHRYLKQIQCTYELMDRLINKLDSNPSTKNSTIIIHGDHGSRLSTLEKPPMGESIDLFSSEEYIQFFSAFFAVRSPSLSAGYDRRPLALDELLEISVLGKTTIPDKEKFVYSYSSGTENFELFELPPFANGSKVPTW